MDDILASVFQSILINPSHAEFWQDRELICKISGKDPVPEYYVSFDMLAEKYDLLVNLGWSTITLCSHKNLKDVLVKIQFDPKVLPGPYEIQCPKDENYEIIKQNYKSMNVVEQE